MDRKQLDAILRDVLAPLGIRAADGRHYLAGDTVIAVVAPQRSQFSNSHYVNYGFLIRALHPDEPRPKVHLCDIAGGIVPGPEFGAGVGGAYDLDSADPTLVRESIRRGTVQRVLPMLREGPARYFELFPEMARVTKWAAREYLGV